jgi:hypothetical protein
MSRRGRHPTGTDRKGADSGHRGTNRARCFVDPLR